MGLGFTCALFLIAAVRELLGTGGLFAAADGTGGVQILGAWFSPAAIFLLPSGAFLTLGFLIALVQKIGLVNAEKERRRMYEEDALNAGYHETLMRDPETGKIVRKPTALSDATAKSPDTASTQEGESANG